MRKHSGILCVMRHSEMINTQKVELVPDHLKDNICRLISTSSLSGQGAHGAGSTGVFGIPLPHPLVMYWLYV